MKKRLNKVIIRDLLFVSLIVGYYFLSKYTGFGIPCIFKTITGYDCPGCGVTRMIFALIRLDFQSAFNFNPLVFIYFPFIIFYFLYEDYLYIYERKDKVLSKIPNYVWTILIIITITFGIVRNIY